MKRSWGRLGAAVSAVALLAGGLVGAHSAYAAPETVEVEFRVAPRELDALECFLAPSTVD